MAAGLFYMWTVATSAPFSFSAGSGDVYNLMATGFLRGHLYLPVQPPAGLLHLANPFDPAQNAPYQAAFHDFSLRNGHFYSPWGASPVLIFLLFRLTSFDLSASFAVAFYALVGLACGTLLLRILVRRLVPRTPGWMVVFASAGLALTNAAPFLLRRPLEYEVAIAGGYCFLMIGLLLITTAVLARPWRSWRLGAGSLCLGLAILARPTLIVGVLAAFAAGCFLVRVKGASWRVLIPALVPVLLCGVALAAYNQARFGSPTQLGQSYQLASIDVHNKPTDQLSYVPPGVFSYLLIPPQIALTFPHVFLKNSLVYPFGLPAGYSGTEGVPIEPDGGMLVTMPITLLLFALALPSLWRIGENRAPATVMAGFTAACLAVIVLLSYGLWGTTQRYEVDFATLALIPAFVMWALLVDRAGRRRRLRRVTMSTGVILTTLGALMGTAVSFSGYQDLLRLGHPGTFEALEDITSPFATAATVIVGKPELVRVDTGPLPVSVPLGPTQAGASAWLGLYPMTLVVVSPGSRRLGIGATVTAGAGAPAPSQLTILVSSPGHRPVKVPVLGAGVRLPVSLHLGLNRIHVSLVGRPTSADELELGDLQLIS